MTSPSESTLMRKITDLENRLLNIEAITNAYYNGTIIITTEQNGYQNGKYGLDVIMATINNHVIDGLQESTKLKGGHFYVQIK